jgi:hypothetical protein
VLVFARHGDRLGLARLTWASSGTHRGVSNMWNPSVPATQYLGWMPDGKLAPVTDLAPLSGRSSNSSTRFDTLNLIAPLGITVLSVCDASRLDGPCLPPSSGRESQRPDPVVAAVGDVKDVA